MRAASLLVLAAALLPAQTIDPKYMFEAGKIRALILSGRNNHEWRETTPHLRRILEATGRFDVRVTEEPAGLTSESVALYDVLIVDYCGPRWGAAAEKAVEGFVKSGKGLVAIHAASYPFGDVPVLGQHMTNTGVKQAAWPAWREMLGGSWSEQAPKSGHGKRHVYEVKFTDPSHPIAAGLKPSFSTADELYHNLRTTTSVKVLATAFDSPAINGTGKDEPVLWTVNFGQGRVFHSVLGHDVAAMLSEGFMATFARGTQWAASGKVDLPAQVALNPKNKDAVRVLLVTGGHDHDASFYEVLDGMRDIRVNVDPHPVAYRNDLRKAYDVIVMYDMVQDLPEAQRKNLQEFAESGKPIVALHHSIANYQSWEWWWRELVGGKYLLKDEMGMKASTYLHDVDLVATPVGEHPVVKGLPPMKIYDETYKGMWRAPGVQVLLTTDHPTSDTALAWISPYSKAKVVYIQLGHGREAHENPWYRQLVRNAVLWSVGRK